MSRIDVSLETGGRTLFAGSLFTHFRGRRLSTSFSYDPNYLADRAAYDLEPALPLDQGAHGFPDGLPYSFKDACPDRWGRELIRKRLMSSRGAGNGHPRELTDIDYLLGTSDFTRQGALRFKQEGSADFEAADTTVPKLIMLPELLAASTQVAHDAFGTASDLAAVKMLLDAGTASLGGARPKASVLDKEALSIAKFPHPSDAWDVMRWEKIALDLARAAGVAVPESRLLTIDGSSVLLLRRFDRDLQARRIGYISALTLLERDDGQSGDYVEIADTLATVSEAPAEDLAQLWRRILVSIYLHNTDDHLRNHGLLRGKRGWRLSPAFDINPEPVLTHTRATSIDGVVDAADEWSALWGARAWFGLSDEEAQDIAQEVSAAFIFWKDIARRNGATQKEIELFAPILSRALS
ncbi:MAG: type II toxin-antitoxin system HipA family toxin [Coriobacteriia bacterium]|nr:type II toxin-antitoxin system HipA family toxin [Coriobacteriia bacterium]